MVTPGVGRPPSDTTVVIYMETLRNMIFARWMNPIFRKGYKEKLEQSNLYPVADYHQSEYLTTQLEKYVDLWLN